MRVFVSPEGTTRAITVTKNIYMGGTWIFNAHLWDTAKAESFFEIGWVDLSSVFGVPDHVSGLPWSLCARVVGDRLTFVAWPGVGTRPAWGDGRYGRSVVLPPGWTYPGAAGWYIGHLKTGGSTTFTNLAAKPLARSP